jgi:AraC-like DNA-binding protein
MDSSDQLLDFIDMSVVPLDIRIHAADTLRNDPAWQWKTPGTPGRQFVFWVVTDGRGKLVAGCDTISLQRGECIISRMWEPHDGTQLPDHLLCIPWSVFEYVRPGGREAVLPQPLPSRQRRLENVDFVAGLAERMIDTFRSGPRAHAEAAHWMKALLLEVERHDQSPALYGEDREQHHRIRSLAETIRREPGVAHTLGAMAAGMNYSPDHFVRVFRRSMGVTPMEYVIRCRVEQARHLLLFSSHPVGRIAEMLGYHDVGYFTRQFTTRMGVPPSRYRRPHAP